jgi:hypothetical protein
LRNTRLKEKLTTSLPFFPFLVVINITPLAAEEPYNDVEAASFKTLIDSTSRELIAATDPLKTTPSTTYNGLFPALIEEKPLILIAGNEPYCPEL